MSARIPDVSAVLFTQGFETLLSASVRSLQAQQEAEVEVVLVATPETGSARSLLEALATRPGVRLVESPSASRPAARAAGARAARAGTLLFPSPGDSLRAGYFAEALARQGAGAPGLVSSWEILDKSGGPELRAPAVAPDLKQLLADPWLLHDATLVRRAAVESVGGLDPELPCLELWELWLRLLAAGHGAQILETPYLQRPAGPGSPCRLDLDPELQARGLERVFEKHRARFEAEVVHVLAERERVLTEKAHRHRVLVERRQCTLREIEELKSEADRLRAALAEAGDSGVDWGELRRVRPLDPDWGYSRGTPVDRFYIERFLEQNALDVQGEVLEVQEADYTRRFGGQRVTRSDVLDLTPSNTGANVIADLRAAPAIRDDSYDCVILTQTAHVIDDMPAVLRECRRILRPGGVLLATFPATSRACLEYGAAGDFWRVTEAGARLLAAQAFGVENVEVSAYGNVLTTTAFLYGMALEELRPDEFEAFDPYHPLLLGVRARKAGAPAARLRGSPGQLGAVLLFHRVAQAVGDFHGIAVPPAEFRAQMELLRRSCNVLPLEELVARARGEALPPRALALSFDDGYADNLVHASPVLVELGLPATFFVTGEGLLSPHEFWWDVLERTLLSDCPAEASLELRLRGERRRFPVATREERAACHAALYPSLVGAPPEERDAVVATLLAWSGQTLATEPDRRPVSADELRRLAARAGHSIGAHGAHHRALPELDAGEKASELGEGRARLEQALGRPVRVLAYPFGAFDDASVDAAQAAGFELALTCEESVVGPGTHPLKVGRFEVKPGGRGSLAALLERAFAAARTRP